MTARRKFIVVALLTLMVVVSVVTIAMDTREARVVPAYGGTYVEGVTGVPQYLNPVIAATDVDQDIARLVFSGLTRFDRDGALSGHGRRPPADRPRPQRGLLPHETGASPAVPRARDPPVLPGSERGLAGACPR